MSAKFNLAGFLRGLLGRADRAPARPVVPVGPASALAPASAPPRLSSSPASPAPARAVNLDELELPLASVVTGLPLELRAKLMAAPPAGQTIRLSAEMIITQLAFGAVKISFGELRCLAPGIFVNSGGELDNKLISLPLQEILPRLNPALLGRRAARKVEVAEEIVGPFADRGRGFSFTTQPLKPPPPAPAPEPASVARMAFVPPASERQVSMPATPVPLPPRALTTLPPGNELPRGHTLPLSPLPPSAGSSPNHYAVNGHGPVNGNGIRLTVTPGLRLGSLNGNGHARVETTGPLKMSPPAGAAAADPTPSPTVIFAPLADLSEKWPEALKEEIARASLSQVTVPLERALILPGLRRGRVVMIWKQLRLLARPDSAASPQDHLELELPLKVLAPLFLAAQKTPARPPAKAPVSTEIPDLFFGFPQPAAAASVAPVPKPPEEKPQDLGRPGWGEKAEALPADEAGLRRSAVPHTDFMSQQAHPKDVVVRATALPGVAGAVVALQDGLCVASKIPGELNADTLAAFLPQIFERVNQSTRELRMGTLNDVSFTVGNAPWRIFRINAVYFAAFARPGDQLPANALTQLAAELDRKKQQ